MDTMTKNSLADSMSQFGDSQTRDLDEDSTRGFEIIARLFGVPRHEEASIDPDRSLSTNRKEPIIILSDIMPPHETPNPRVTSEPPAETDAPLHVSIKNDSRVISELRNSFDYTQDIECITLEGHSEHTDAVYGPVMEGHSEHTGADVKLVALCNAASNAQISVSSKYASSAMISVTSAEDETVYHEEYDSYLNDDSTGIPTGVISAPALLNNSYSKHERSFLPQVSCGNNLHVDTELDENFSEVDTVIDTTGFGGLVRLFNVANCHNNILGTVDEADQYDNISTFDDESLGMILTTISAPAIVLNRVTTMQAMRNGQKKQNDCGVDLLGGKISNHDRELNQMSVKKANQNFVDGESVSNKIGISHWAGLSEISREADMKSKLIELRPHFDELEGTYIEESSSLNDDHNKELKQMSAKSTNLVDGESVSNSIRMSHQMGPVEISGGADMRLKSKEVMPHSDKSKATHEGESSSFQGHSGGADMRLKSEEVMPHSDKPKGTHEGESSSFQGLSGGADMRLKPKEVMPHSDECEGTHEEESSSFQGLRNGKDIVVKKLSYFLKKKTNGDSFLKEGKSSGTITTDEEDDSEGTFGNFSAQKNPQNVAEIPVPTAILATNINNKRIVSILEKYTLAVTPVVNGDGAEGEEIELHAEEITTGLEQEQDTNEKEHDASSSSSWKIFSDSNTWNAVDQPQQRETLIDREVVSSDLSSTINGSILSSTSMHNINDDEESESYRNLLPTSLPDERNREVVVSDLSSTINGSILSTTSMHNINDDEESESYRNILPTSLPDERKKTLYQRDVVIQENRFRRKMWHFRKKKRKKKESKFTLLDETLYKLEKILEENIEAEAKEHAKKKLENIILEKLQTNAEEQENVTFKTFGLRNKNKNREKQDPNLSPVCENAMKVKLHAVNIDKGPTEKRYQVKRKNIKAKESEQVKKLEKYGSVREFAWMESHHRKLLGLKHLTRKNPNWIKFRSSN